MFMNPLLQRLQTFSAAEDFLDFFAVEYQPSVVHVNRLHILKRFNQYLAQTPIPEDMDEATARSTCKTLLTRAYEDFVHSTAAQEKVFKVFQEGSSVSLDSLKRNLPSRRQG